MAVLEKIACKGYAGTRAADMVVELSDEAIDVAVLLIGEEIKVGCPFLSTSGGLCHRAGDTPGTLAEHLGGSGHYIIPCHLKKLK